MTAVAARLEPPPSDGLRAATAAFDCVQIVGPGGEEDPGEAFVREFLRSGGCEDAARSGTATTYLWTDPDQHPGVVIGYITLSLTQVRLTGSETKQHDELSAAGRADFGALRIAMIGVDRHFAGQGHGKALLEVAIYHAARMSDDVSVRFIVADAANTQLHWYQRQEFVENSSQHERERVARIPTPATSMRLDLGPDPRALLLVKAN